MRLASALLLALSACTAIDDATPGSTTGTGGPKARLPRTPVKTAQSPYDDDGPLGSMVRTYLRSSPARRLVVEIDYVGSRAPSGNAMNHLEEVLRGVADKPGGIGVERGSSIPSGRSSWSVQDLRALEAAHRGARSAGETASMWLVYVDGTFADGEGALGVAYSASAAAIFRERINDATTAIVNATAIERAVITHEAGHLLALVNIGYRSTIDHEDPQHPHHSRNDESVMFWAVEDLALKNVLSGGPPDEFDRDDRADLAALKAG